MVGKRSIKKIIFSLILVASCVCLFNVFKTDKINKILKTNDYNYLSKEAKDYVKEIYENNGYVLLTEKNKQQNMPYLNPRYIAYLEASEEERKEYNVVPSAVITDYIGGGDKANKEFPETFDLRNVNGVNYTTPNRHQGSSSLCAFFTTVATLESNLLYQRQTPYSNDAEKFSERQLDYALSDNGIKEYPQTYNRNLYADGANFEDLVRVTKNGLGFTELNKMPFDTSTNQKLLSDVLNFNNSKYELNESINFEYLDPTIEDQEMIDSYVNMIKDYVMTYGGVYVATGAPDGGCAYAESNVNNYIIYDTNDTRDDDKCTLRYHAMEIIGWDDNVSYEFCANPNTKQHTDNISGCPSENIIRGKGAWILKNSWGNAITNPYLAYNSRNSAINAIINVSETSGRNWDKIYTDDDPKEKDNGYSLEYTLKKNSDLRETLDKIKVEVNWMRYFNLNVYYSPTGSNQDKILLDTRQTIDASLYTIDINDEIEINDGAKITLTTTTSGANVFALYMQNYGDVTAYATTMDEGVYLNTEDISVNRTSDNNDYSFYVKTNTQNIESGELINYELYDENDNKIKNEYISYTENIVGPNLALTKITINNIIPKGNYKLRSIYREDYSVSNLELTSSDITSNYGYIKLDYNHTNAEIEFIRYNLNDNYILDTEIDNYDGYQFYEWNTKSDGSGEKVLSSNDLAIGRSEVKTVYAIYNTSMYKIIFHSNNNKNETYEQFANQSEDVQLTNVPFVNEFHNFLRWNTEADGSGTYYENMDYVSNLANVGDEIYLYAIWEVQSYNIIYNSNNESNETITDNVIINNDYYIRDNTFEYGEYTFAGWDTKVDGTGTRYKEEQLVSFLADDKETVNLYAIWIIEYATSDKYEVDDTKITDINDNTSVNDFTRNLNVDSSYTVKIRKNGNELSSNDVISTGSVTSIYDGDILKAEFTNVVAGDVNGNGTITISDIAKIFSHIMGFSNMDENYNILAADVNGSGTITISDVSKIYSYIMGFNGGVL